MILRWTVILETIFALAAIAGLCLDTVPHWEAWLCMSLFCGLDTWRCWRVGEVSTAGLFRGSFIRFDSEESPLIFTCLMICQGLLTLACFGAFLFYL